MAESVLVKADWREAEVEEVEKEKDGESWRAVGSRVKLFGKGHSDVPSTMDSVPRAQR
jgi:hypothetical protein